jgi:hypothetical protein
MANFAKRITTPVPADVTQTRRGLGTVQPQPGNLAGQSVPSRIIFPWWVERPDAALDFTAEDFNVTLAAGVGATATSANLTFQIPQGMVGVVQIFGIYALNQLATTSVRYDLRINQGPVPGWSKQNLPGIANIFAQDFSDVRVRVMNAGKLDMLFTNLNGNGPWTVGGHIAGWILSQATVQRLGGDSY